MADHNHSSGQRPIHPFDPKELTKQFEQRILTQRLNHLSLSRSRSRSGSPAQLAQASPASQPSSRHASRSNDNSTVLPTYASLRNLPKIASPPQDAASLRFRNQLLTLSIGPTKYENPGLLDEALSVIPLDRIYGEAEDESQLLQAQANSIGDNRKAEWGYQDCVIRALLRYVCQETSSCHDPNFYCIDGSSAPFSHLSIILHVLSARRLRSQWAWHPQHRMKLLEVLPV